MTQEIAMKILYKESLLLLLLLAPVCTLHAAGTDLDCSKKSLQGAIDKLTKEEPNVVTISGTCTEDIVVSGFADLTLVGNVGASITATVFDNLDQGNSTLALLVENSKVTVETLTINAGSEGVACQNRSTCTIRNATIQGGWNGMSLTDQSAGDILGSTTIKNSLGNGLGIFGASTVNMRAEPRGEGIPGPVISGHGDGSGIGIGVLMLDGSFLRTDDVTISGNDTGVVATRDVNIKILGGEVSGSAFDGIDVTNGSTAQIRTTVSDNLGTGIFLGPLTFAQIFSDFSGNGSDVDCSHVTSISQPSSLCGN
jgi:hypothetical protein